MVQKKKMKFVGDSERIFPGYGQFKPGDEVEYDETLLSTGLFDEKKGKLLEKDGDR